MINFGATQITAKCSKKTLDSLQKLIYHKKTVEKTRVRLSYDAAFYLWDKLRWKHNKVRIIHPGNLEWMIIEIKSKRLGVLSSRGHGQLLVEHGWDVVEFFFDRNDLVDPYIVYFKKNATDLLIEMLDDIVNRIEQLRIRDETNFKWKDGKIDFVGIRQAQLFNPIQP